MEEIRDFLYNKTVSDRMQEKNRIRERQMTKKQRTLEIIERLKREYPDSGCTLDYDQAWKLLVSVRLAAQCTDARVTVVVEEGGSGGQTAAPVARQLFDLYLGQADGE